MSNEELHIDGDFTLNIPHFEADFTENEQPKMQADFKIQTGGSTSFANITGNPYDNEALSDALNQKADNSTVEALSETVENNYTELDGKITDESDSRTQADADLQSNIDDVADDLSIETDNRQSADEDLQDNIDTVDGKINTHIADKTNPHEVTKTQVGLGNVDNTSDLNKPISTATQTALNGKQDAINDLSDIRTNAENGQSAYNTIQTYGDIVTYDASSFATSTQGQKADTALQPNDNITELNNNAGYITSASLPTVNNNKITIQKNSTDAGSFTLNQSSDKTINISVPTQASDINAVPTSRKINNKALSSNITLTASDVNALSSSTTINDLTTSTQQDALNSGATSTNIGQIATNTQNITNEVTNRQNADNNLQSQIDAIVASSDVFDIVGTYAELQAYDISTVPVNDIIKVLVDSTHSNAATYYRCVENNNVKSWTYIGSEGAYYTKSEANSLFVEQTTTVNGKALSNNITLTASDVGALPDNTVIPTVNNGTLTIQQNGTDVQTFGANQSSNVTANITVPTDTSDLTNGAGFITNSALSSYATTTDLTNGLATKQDTIGDLSTIRSNATNGQSAYTTIGGYGDIVTHNASEFATSAQGSLADTSIQPNDNISLLNNNTGFITGINSSDVTTALGYTPYNSSNPSGYTSNVGTVTSVNNTQPDANGNVSLTMPTVNNGVLTITQNGTSKGTFSANQSANDTIALTDTTYNNFTGADGTNAGSSGLVPAPSATDNDKYLKGDGTWASVSGGSSTDVQINGTSITSNNVANILTESAYSSSNKIATMSDIPAAGANTDLSNLSATGEAHFLKNTATGTNALTLLGTPATYDSAINIGAFSSASNLNSTAIGRGSYAGYYATAFGCYSIAGNNFSTAIGENASASDYRATAIGYNASATQNASIQIGYGTNSTANTLSIGFYDGSDAYNYQLLDGTTGLIPDSRISTNIERTSNKVTSISSSSTNTQYPSAKLLYDQLSLKQNTSTAVTHTASTAVGSSTVPVYVNSSGVATSTGLSIASSRFDGQWVYKFSEASTTLSVGTVTMSLLSYLPSDNFQYEVLINLCLYSNPSSGASDVYLWSDVFANTNTEAGQRVARCNANSRASENRFIMPVGTGRWLKRQILDKAATVTCNVSLWGYRRIGTNT